MIKGGVTRFLLEKSKQNRQKEFKPIRKRMTYIILPIKNTAAEKRGEESAEDFAKPSLPGNGGGGGEER